MRPFYSFLNDTNLQLISTYSAIRDEPDAVIDHVNTIQAAYTAAKDKRSFYDHQRDIYNASRPRCNPANFIFLNATCWNGLWRVNRKKEFNVPFGAPKTDSVMPNEGGIRAVSAALQGAQLRAASWESSVASARSGDFVFLDPPYLSDSTQNGTKYGTEEWGMSKHEKLAEACLALDMRGVQFVLTNSGEDELVDLYRDLGLTVNVAFVARAINSKPNRRGVVKELIVSNSSSEKASSDETARVFTIPIRRDTED